ncbi:MAG: Maf family nucleotide pyrophosphatase [Bacteroidales bacterium]|nr:Maf family nucleotide pyrophosphatase [Bacteroidales bacterium]
MIPFIDKDRRLILGSNSPRRRELLAGLGLEFELDARSSFKESPFEGGDAYSLPLKMSEGKSLGFHRPLENDEVLITADTVVIIDGKVLGKPRDKEDAIAMLHLLSGRVHEVVTAVSLRSSEKMKSFSVTTKVEFNELNDSTIEYYVDKFRPFDKAGAYGIQEWIGYVGIKGIEGSYYNVMGLPVNRLYRELLEF